MMKNQLETKSRTYEIQKLKAKLDKMEYNCSKKSERNFSKAALRITIRYNLKHVNKIKVVKCNFKTISGYFAKIFSANCRMSLLVIVTKSPMPNFIHNNSEQLHFECMYIWMA